MLRHPVAPRRFQGRVPFPNLESIRSRHLRFRLVLRRFQHSRGRRTMDHRPSQRPPTSDDAVISQPSGNHAFGLIGSAGGRLNCLNLTGTCYEAEQTSAAQGMRRSTAPRRSVSLWAAAKSVRDDFVKVPRQA